MIKVLGSKMIFSVERGKGNVDSKTTCVSGGGGSAGSIDI